MITGGCFCGAVRYELDGSLCNARACHCSRCRRAFSSASSAYAEIAEGGEFRWTAGERSVTKYESAQSWALLFCRVCGSSLGGVYEGNVHGLTLGCVDGDPGVEIEKHIFVDSKAPWDHIGGIAPQHAEHAE